LLLQIANRTEITETEITRDFSLPIYTLKGRLDNGSQMTYRSSTTCLTIACLTIVGSAFLLVCAHSPLAYASEWRAASTVTGTKKSPFEWEHESPPVSASIQDNEPLAIAKLTGRYNGEITKLLVVDQKEKEKEVILNGNKFAIDVPLAAVTTAVLFRAVSSKGITEEIVTIHFPSLPEFLSVERTKRQESDDTQEPKSYNIALGLTSFSYKEGTQLSYSATAPTLKASYESTLSNPDWNFEISGFLTLFDTVKNLPNTQARLLGIDLRVGYSLPFLQTPWKVSIVGGLGFFTMFVTENAFGLTSFIAPEIFPTIRRTIAPGQAVFGYVKYVPTSEGFGLFSWREKELGLGAGFEFLWDNQHPMTVTLDLSDFSVVNPKNGLATHLGSVSLSLGYSL
jgi:hypothetical protein